MLELPSAGSDQAGARRATYPPVRCTLVYLSADWRAQKKSPERRVAVTGLQGRCRPALVHR